MLAASASFEHPCEREWKTASCATKRVIAGDSARPFGVLGNSIATISARLEPGEVVAGMVGLNFGYGLAAVAAKSCMRRGHARLIEHPRMRQQARLRKGDGTMREKRLSVIAAAALSVLATS